MSVEWLTREQVREVDRRAVEEFGVPGVVLMENAGRSVAEILMRQEPGGRVVIAAGKGNNGGDGFVIARHLAVQGYRPQVLLLGDPDSLRGDAAINFRILEPAGIPVHQVTFTESGDGDVGRPVPDAETSRYLAEAAWIVDALLGTGVEGEVRPRFAAVIEAINASPAQVLAVDLPSGLDCNTGEVMGVCVRADHTVTFLASKRGFTEKAAGLELGVLHVVGLGIPERMWAV